MYVLKIIDYSTRRYNFINGEHIKVKYIEILHLFVFESNSNNMLFTHRISLIYFEIVPILDF